MKKETTETYYVIEQEMLFRTKRGGWTNNVLRAERYKYRFAAGMDAFFSPYGTVRTLKITTTYELLEPEPATN